MHLSAYLIFCLFATFLAGVRYLITDTTDLVGLVWNLLLGFIPYLFALWYESDKRKISRFVAFFFWIFFLPNSFYILTDFIHLHKYPEMAFYDIVYISAMAFAGMIAGFASIEIFHREYNIHYHKKIAWIFIGGIFTLSMFGVYIGRFLRFNSWDIFQSPLAFLEEVWMLLISNGQVWNIADPFRKSVSQLFEVGAMGLWQFVLLYGSFFFIVYVYLYHAKKK